MTISQSRMKTSRVSVDGLRLQRGNGIQRLVTGGRVGPQFGNAPEIPVTGYLTKPDEPGGPPWKSDPDSRFRWHSRGSQERLRDSRAFPDLFPRHAVSRQID